MFVITGERENKTRAFYSSQDEQRYFIYLFRVGLREATLPELLKSGFPLPVGWHQVELTHMMSLQNTAICPFTWTPVTTPTAGEQRENFSSYSIFI